MTEGIADLSREEVEARLWAALRHLRKRDRYLLEVVASERSITHHLANYLGYEFPRWNVDVEYNRDANGRDLKKRLLGLQESLAQAGHDPRRSDLVLPDIIVHQRGTSENLLVVEAKHASNREGSGVDHIKLIEFTKPEHRGGLGYRWGVHVVFDEDSAAAVQWFAGGSEVVPGGPGLAG